MTDLAVRFAANPLLRPSDVKPSLEGLVVECLLNPGVFEFEGMICLLIRVAERPVQQSGTISVPVLSPTSHNGISIESFSTNDSDLRMIDSRLFEHRGATYLTTLSHLRLARSRDGVHFSVDDTPTLIGDGDLEAFGIEDCRVVKIDGTYCLTYSAVSSSGVGVGLITTEDWHTFSRKGMAIPPSNKDCALFPRKVDGSYWAMHRPSGVGIGGNFIWLAKSPDLEYWGHHACIAKTRPGMWDEQRIGAGASPICTRAGWLAIYHGANHAMRYCLGALLMDLNDPTKVIARSIEPIMEPLEDYETKGFFGNVVFTNGHIHEGDRLRIYYGASDEVICGADFSVEEILKSLGV